MKSHSTIGARILEGSTIPLLNLAAEIALGHHERWDGSGYPKGLSGDAIPESARIVAVLAVYDALVHDRAYRPAMPEREAIATITDGKGAHFAPKALEAFHESLPELRRIRAEIKEVARPDWSGGGAGTTESCQAG